MNVQQIINRAIKEMFNETGTSSGLITPVQVVDALNDIILGHYWSIFQDKEYSYFKISEQVLNIGTLTNIYPLPNGDPAQTDDIEFSSPPAIASNKTWSIMVIQGKNTFNPAVFNTTMSLAQIQNLINTATANGGPQCTITPTLTGGMLILWDTTTVTTPVTITLLTNNLGVNILDTTRPANISNLNVAFVTTMRQRSGSYPNYSYSSPVVAVNPQQKYNNGVPGPFNFQAPWLTNSQGGNPFSWCFDSGLQDGNGYATFYIRFIKPPMTPGTMIYDCLRYPTLLSNVLTNGNINGNQVPDLPAHFHPLLVYRVLEEAYITAGLDTSEIMKKIEVLEERAYAVESMGVQRQGHYGIQREN